MTDRTKHLAAAAWLMMQVAVTGGSLLALLGAILPYAILKSTGDRLAKDGSLEWLSPERYLNMRTPLLAAGLILLVLAAALFAFRKPVQSALISLGNRCAAYMKAARLDAIRLVLSLRDQQISRVEWIALGLLVLIAVALRLVFIQRAAQYDEVYSYLEFARHSFGQVLSDYHVPNNHVLNTLFMRVSILLFGNSLWAIRLPAFITGLLLVPAMYVLGRVVYGRWTGLAAATAVTVAPQLVLYSTNGRGYMLVCLFTLLTYALAAILRTVNNRAAWLGMALFTALGFYSIPVMLYPFGGLLLWLVLTGVFKDFGPAYSSRLSWFRNVAGFCAIAGVLTFLFYSPIILRYGPLVFISGSNVTAGVSWPAFLSSLGPVSNEIRGEWGFGMPAWAPALILTGLFISTMLNKRLSGSKTPFALTLFTFMLVELVIHRPILLGRVMLFLLPLLILWGLAGWVGLASVLLERLPGAVPVFTAALLGGLLILGGLFIQPYLGQQASIRQMWGEDVEQTTLYLKERLRPGDVVVVSYMIDARYWYYFDLHHIPQEAIRSIKSRPFRRVYAVLEPGSYWTIDTLMKDFGPDTVFLQPDSLGEIRQIGKTHVYSLEANLRALQKAYGPLPSEWAEK